MDDTEILVITTLAVSGATFFILIIYIICDCCRDRRRRGDEGDEGSTYVSERTYLSSGLQEGISSKTTTLKSVASGQVMLAAHQAGVTSAPDKASLDTTIKASSGHDYWPWQQYTDPRTDQVNFTNQTEVTNSCQSILPTIASLETTCKTLAGDIDRCAGGVKDVSVKSEELPTNITAVSKMQADQRALTTYWGGVRRMLYCADVQLRHAALYQKFNLDLKQLQRLLETTRDSNKKSLTKDTMRLHTADDLANLISTTKASVETLRTWETMQRHLSERSVTLVPVALRSQPLTRRLPLRALCAYTSDQIHITEGETLTLINSTNMTVWRVQTAEGVEGDVPAVCLLIPPPDNDAIEAAARLHRLLLDTFDTSRLLLEKRVVVITRHLLSDMAKKKANLFSVLSGEHKEQLLSRLGLVETVTRDRCTGYEQYPDIERHLKSVHKLVEASSQLGDEDQKLERDVLVASEKLIYLYEDYELLSKRYETLKSLFDGVPLKALAVPSADAEARSNATVRMLSSSPKDALRMSTDEWKRTLAIQAIVDPDTDEEVSLDIAVNRGIIDPESNAYVNRKTGERFPIPVATAAGFILVSEVGQQQTEAPVTTVEIVGISMRHDTRPYTVWRVREMDSEKWMGVQDAVKKGWLRPIVNVYCNLVTGDEMSLDAALDLGLLQVEFPENSVPTVSRVVRYFAMYGLVDRAHNGRVLSYNDAFDRGLLDKGDGTVHDTLTGRWTTIPEALLQRWVRAAVIEDVENFDAQKFIKNHSSTK